MKFNKYIPLERRALREWVKEGNSVYENTSCAWYDGQVPVEFLTVYRDEAYIRKHTKGMKPKEVRRFEMNYYGWDDSVMSKPDPIENDLLLMIPNLDEELPFK